MKKFNARKSIKEHYLFLNKHHKLGFTRHVPSFMYDCKYPEHAKVVCVDKKAKRIIATGKWLYSMVEFYDALVKTGLMLSLTKMIENFETVHGVKIADLGLTRLDFSRYRNFNASKKIEKIYKRKNLNMDEKKEKIRKIQKLEKELRLKATDKINKAIGNYHEEQAEKFAELHTTGLCTDDLDDVPF